MSVNVSTNKSDICWNLQEVPPISVSNRRLLFRAECPLHRGETLNTAVTSVKIQFLGALAKLRKATLSFVMSACAHGTTRLPLNGCSRNFTFEDFSKICRENSSFFKKNSLTRITGTLREDLCTLMIISPWIFRKMRNVSHKGRREYQNTHCMFNNIFPPENRAAYEIMWKNMVQPDRLQMTI